METDASEQTATLSSSHEIGIVAAQGPGADTAPTQRRPEINLCRKL